jgi:hypothetical protein
MMVMMRSAATFSGAPQLSHVVFEMALANKNKTIPQLFWLAL